MCTYCGKEPATRDHVPSKILLDSPFPENLPVVESCEKCNQGFSKDEEYVACLIDCIIAGSTNPKDITRHKIKSILLKRPLLRSRIENSKRVSGDEIFFEVEEKRLEKVIMKLARGHARFENSESMLDNPEFIEAKPIHLFNSEEKNSFYNSTTDLLPEVGSRGMFRIFKDDSVDTTMWVTVQENNYMYSVSHQHGSIVVKFLLRDYLACIVIW